MEPRPLFVHIPKCAGTSLMREMTREYGQARVFRFYGDTDARVDELRAMPAEARHDLRALGGHVRFGIDPLVGGPLTACTLLRDPVARLASHYAYVLRHRQEPIQARLLGGATSFDEYITRSPGASAFNNGMVRLLGGDALEEDAPADERHLHAALARIDDGRIVVGLQERYAESLALFACHFGWRRVAVDYVNVGTDAPTEAALAPTSVALVERHNALDRALLDAVRPRFAALIATTDGLAAELRKQARRTRARRLRARLAASRRSWTTSTSSPCR